jgi:hypothetical protein
MFSQKAGQVGVSSILFRANARARALSRIRVRGSTSTPCSPDVRRRSGGRAFDFHLQAVTGDQRQHKFWRWI